MAAFVLEDLTGKIDVVSFPESFGRFGTYLREGQLVWIKGKYMGEEENRRISLSAAMPLAEAFEKQAKRVVVRIFLPGLEDATIAACDFTVRIPMHHGVDSLNVAAASAVAFYQLGRRA